MYSEKKLETVSNSVHDANVSNKSELKQVLGKSLYGEKFADIIGKIILERNRGGLILDSSILSHSNQK